MHLNATATPGRTTCLLRYLLREADAVRAVKSGKGYKRGNFEGSFVRYETPRRNGTIRVHWQAFVSATLPDGRRKRVSGTGRTKGNAMHAAEQRRAEALAKARSHSVGDATLGVFLDRWIEDKAPELQPTTADSYRRVITNLIKPHIGAIPIAELRPCHVKDLNRAILEAGSTQKTGWRTHRILHTALNYARALEVIPSNPASGLTPRKPKAKQFTPLTAEQCDRFLKAAESERLYALYALAITTGMRQGELLGLQWDDVDFSNATLSLRRQARFLNGVVSIVERTKNGKDRQIMLSRPALEALQEHRKKIKGEIDELRSRKVVREKRDDPDYWRKVADKIEACPQIFCSPQGDLVDAKNFLKRNFYPLLKRSGIPRIRFHDLRHTFATLALSKNVHPVVVQRTLGHSTIALTIDTYSGWIPTMQEQVVAAMDSLFGPDREKIALKAG